MPVTFSEIVSDTAQVSFRFADNDITLTYHPGRVTEETFQLSFQFGEMDTSTFDATFKSFNQELSNLVSSWDVYIDEEKTQMYPLDADHLVKLPILFRVRVLQAILGDIRPN